MALFGELKEGKRMDTESPFSYWTLNERYSEEPYPLFDARLDYNGDEDDNRSHPLLLHRLQLNQREDSSIFVVWSAHHPTCNHQTIRQSFHCPGNYLPPSPWSGYENQHSAVFSWLLVFGYCPFNQHIRRKSEHFYFGLKNKKCRFWLCCSRLSTIDISRLVWLSL